MKIKIVITSMFLIAIIVACSKEESLDYKDFDHIYFKAPKRDRSKRDPSKPDPSKPDPSKPDRSKLLVTSDSHQIPVHIQKNGDIVVGNTRYHLIARVSDTQAIYRENNDSEKNICFSFKNGELWEHKFGGSLFKDCLKMLQDGKNLETCIKKALNKDNAPRIPTSRFAMIKDPEYRFSKDPEDILTFLKNVRPGVSKTYLLDIVNQNLLKHSESNRIYTYNKKIAMYETHINLIGTVLKSIEREYIVYAILDDRTCILRAYGNVEPSFQLAIFSDNRIYMSTKRVTYLNEFEFKVPADLFDIKTPTKILQYTND